MAIILLQILSLVLVACISGITPSNVCAQPVTEHQSNLLGGPTLHALSKLKSAARLPGAGHDRCFFLASKAEPGESNNPPDRWAPPTSDTPDNSWWWLPLKPVEPPASTQAPSLSQPPVSSPVPDVVRQSPPRPIKRPAALPARSRQVLPASNNPPNGGRKRTLFDDANYLKFIGGDGSELAPPTSTLSGIDHAKKTADAVINDINNIDFSLPKGKHGEALCYLDFKLTKLVHVEGPFLDLMFHSVSPSDQRSAKVKVKNPYCVLTAPYEPLLSAKILASAGKLSQEDILPMALAVCNKNYPLAVLTAHNLLKEVTEEGRAARDKGTGELSRGRQYAFPAYFGEFVSKLRNMRTEAGDKIGMWYHSFIPLCFAAWSDDPDTADLAILMEYGGRTSTALHNWFTCHNYPYLASWVPNFDSSPDIEKRLSDTDFATYAARPIQEARSQLNRPAIIAICNACVTPEKGAAGTNFRLRLDYQLQGHADSKVHLKRDIDVAGRPKSAIDHGMATEEITYPTHSANQSFNYEGTTGGKFDFDYALSAADIPKVALGSIPFEVLSAKLPPVIITVERSDNHSKIEGAQVDLMPVTSTSAPASKVWTSQKTDVNGKAEFMELANDNSSGLIFDGRTYHLAVRASHPQYETEQVDLRSGPRSQDNQPYTMTVRLKPRSTPPTPNNVYEFQRSGPEVNESCLLPMTRSGFMQLSGNHVDFYYFDMEKRVKVKCSSFTFTALPETVHSEQEVLLQLSCSSVAAGGDVWAAYNVVGHCWTDFKKGDEKKAGVCINRPDQGPTKPSTTCSILVDSRLNSPAGYPYYGKPKPIPHAPQPFTVLLTGNGGHGQVELKWTYTPEATATHQR